VLLLLQRWFVPHNYRQLALQFLIGGSVYGLGILWAFLSNKALRVGELAAKKDATAAESKVVAPPVEIYQQDV
jgi:putative effector of murein hydrolase LrgA (UPF0299 family)